MDLNSILDLIILNPRINKTKSISKFHQLRVCIYIYIYIYIVRAKNEATGLDLTWAHNVLVKWA